MTTQIIESVLKEAKKQGAKKVTEVHVIIGKLTFLAVEQVRFSYNILAKESIMKGSKLIIEEKDGTIECSNCGYRGTIPIKDDPTYHIPIPTLQCPKCGKATRIVEGKECTIKRIKMVKEE